GGVPARPKFIPEFRGHLISARVTSIADGKVASGVDCFLSFPSSPFGLSVAKTDSNGIVSFEVNNYYGPGEIIIQASRDITSSYRVDVLTAFAGETGVRAIPFFSLTTKEEMALSTSTVAMQAQHIYVADSIRWFNTTAL